MQKLWATKEPAEEAVAFNEDDLEEASEEELEELEEEVEELFDDEEKLDEAPELQKVGKDNACYILMPAGDDGKAPIGPRTDDTNSTVVPSTDTKEPQHKSSYSKRHGRNRDRDTKDLKPPQSRRS